MNDVIIDPYFTFICEEDWEDQDKQICFLESFLKLLEIPDYYPSTSFCWSYEMEELLWQAPTYPPWKYYAKNQTVIIYYHKFFSKAKLFETSGNFCTTNPQMLWHENKSIHNAFSSLVYELVNGSIEFVFFKHMIRTLEAVNCNANNQDYSPPIICDRRSYFLMIPFIEYYWDLLQTNSASFNKCLKIHGFIIGQEHFENEYEFSDSFIDDLRNELEPRFRLNIIDALVKRLCMNSIDAARDTALREEYIDQNDCYRLRVTPRPTSCRIHYKRNGNSMVFSNYYSSGEHDDGI